MSEGVSNASLAVMSAQNRSMHSDWGRTFLLFSNWELILVIMPMAAMKDRRFNTWDTPFLSILNLLMFQFPLLRADSMPMLMVSGLIHLEMSKGADLFALPRALSACQPHRNFLHTLHFRPESPERGRKGVFGLHRKNASR